MTTTLNILHLMMLLASMAAVYFAVREAKGSLVSRGRLMALPLLALPVALTLLIFQQSSDHQPSWVWSALALAGLTAGAVRGVTLHFEVDHTWNVAALPRTREMPCTALVLLLAVGCEVAAVLAAEHGAFLRAMATGGAVLCAGLFAGRALAIQLRFGHAPQVYLRGC